MYDGSNTYDFEAALADAKTVEPKSGLTVEQIYWRKHFPEPPTEAGLRKHAKRFGREGVSEIADAYGMTALAVELAEDSGARGRHTSDAMREQVRALHNRGVVPTAIADTLNISDARVGKLLREPKAVMV
jgi:hypothetical protein